MQGRSNPFTNMTVRVDLDGPMRTIQRDPEVDMVGCYVVFICLKPYTIMTGFEYAICK